MESRVEARVDLPAPGIPHISTTSMAVLREEPTVRREGFVHSDARSYGVLENEFIFPRYPPL